MAGGLDVASGESETHTWSVVIDGLILSGCDLIGFVPDTDGAIGADAAVKGCPCRKVIGIAILSVANEVVEAAPVLCDHDSAPVDGGVRAEKAGVGIGVELAQHRPHRCSRRYPLMEGQQAINAHANEEDDKGAFDVAGVASGEDLAHRNSRTSFMMTRRLIGWLRLKKGSTLYA